MRNALLIIATAVAILASGSESRAGELVMFESASCEWCEVWNEQIGGVYAKTAEGKRAPLRRVDIDDPRPFDLKFIRNVVYTPTFVLVDNGQELGRIVGYPGEDFFWGYLGKILGKLPKSSNIRIRWSAIPQNHQRTSGMGTR